MKNISKTINTKTSGTTSHSQSRINPLLLFNISMYTLAAICFMVYTTELTYVHAEGEEDLGSANSSLDASVTVGTACNFSGNVDIPHTSTVMNGVNSTDIGKTTMNVTCNDEGGYAVYAIGYTNDEYGNNTLRSSVSDDYNISTGTSTSGNTSNWSMKLATVSGTTTATIENGYNNYHTIPDDYTKVASLNTITDPSTPNTGSSISTTYQTYISPTQPAGTYTGKVKYTLVHPSITPAPEKPVTIADAYKASGATKTSQGYYKMQDMNSSINDSVNVIGDSLQAQDIRDNKVYWITKLADGNIWMTQNLDHDIISDENFYTYANTDIGHGDSLDINAKWTGTATKATDDTTWYSGSFYAESYDPGNLYWNGIVVNQTTCEKYGGTWQPWGACDNLNTIASTGEDRYHLGNYYNWTAAVAMNDSSAYINIVGHQDIDQSICPAGWRLSTYEGNKSFIALKNAQNLIAGINSNIQDNPAYFTYSGYWDGRYHNTGSFGAYWSSVAGASDVYQLTFNASFENPETQHRVNRDIGYSVRCLAR